MTVLKDKNKIISTARAGVLAILFIIPSLFILSSSALADFSPKVNGKLIDVCYQSSPASGADCNRKQDAANAYCSRTYGVSAPLATNWTEGSDAASSGGTIYLTSERTCSNCNVYFSSIGCGQTVSNPKVDGYLIHPCFLFSTRRIYGGPNCSRKQDTANAYCSQTYGAGYTAANWTEGSGAASSGGTIYLTIRTLCATCSDYLSSTTCGPPPTSVAGVCGSANGKGFETLDSSLPNLCSAGVVASFTTTGSGWTWYCNGQNGGSNSPQCSANKVYPAKFSVFKKLGRAISGQSFNIMWGYDWATSCTLSTDPSHPQASQWSGVVGGAGVKTLNLTQDMYHTLQCKNDVREAPYIFLSYPLWPGPSPYAAEDERYENFNFPTYYGSWSGAYYYIVPGPGQDGQTTANNYCAYKYGAESVASDYSYIYTNSATPDAHFPLQRIILPSQNVVNSSLILSAITCYVPSGTVYNPPPAGGICLFAKEGGTATLKCPEGGTITEIERADYVNAKRGSVDTAYSCTSAGRVNQQRLCNAASGCVGRNECSFTVDNNNCGGDPAPGVAKKLILNYKCSTPLTEVDIKQNPRLSGISQPIDICTSNACNWRGTADTYCQRTLTGIGSLSYSTSNGAETSGGTVYADNATVCPTCGSYFSTIACTKSVTLNPPASGLCASAAGNNSLSIRCPAGGTIAQIERADYVNNDSPYSCSSSGKVTCLGKCSAPDIQASPDNRCLGQPGCDLTVSNTNCGGDPCSGVPKKLILNVICRVNGVCGSASGVATTAAPAANLCSAGTASAVSGSGPWDWTCNGSNGGTNSSCSAPLIVNGACGPAAVNYLESASGFSGSLCSAGTASPSSPSFPSAGSATTWTCQGSNGGTNASCTATRTLNGACGPAATTYPASASGFSGSFCSAGTPSPSSPAFPAIKSTTTWTCQGAYGGTNASCTATRTAPPFNFSLSNEGNKTATAGGRVVRNQITADLISGSSSSVTLSVSGLPSNASAWWEDVNTVLPTGSKILAIYAATNTPTGSSNITVTGTSGSLTKTTSFTLTVGIFDFSLSNGGNKSVNQGSSVTNTITATLVSGDTRTVGFVSPAGLPSGASASFSPAGLQPTADTTMTITTTADTPGGSYNITVTGNTGSESRTTSFTLTVAAAGVCGSAARNYSFADTGFSGSFCSVGTASPASPAFPPPGGSTTWTCQGLGGGANTTCTANRAGAPPAGIPTLTASPTVVTPGNNVTFSWGPISGATYYMILYRRDNVWDVNWLDNGSATSALFGTSGLSQEVSAQVKACNVSGCGGTSNLATSAIATLTIDSFTASPASGNAPLSGVDLAASVGGNAIGNIQYQFDCTNNGSYEVDVINTSNPYTAIDACNYGTGGNYTARVAATRSGVSASRTLNISITYAPLAVDIKANNSDGPINVTANTNFTLTWTSTNTASSDTACTASNAWSGNQATQNTAGLTRTLGTTSQTYTLTCSNPGGSASDSVTVNPLPPTPANLRVTTPTPIYKGDTVNFAWDSTPAATYYLVAHYFNGTWDFNFVSPSPVNATTISYSNTGALDTLGASVVACNASGCSSGTNTVTATINTRTPINSAETIIPREEKWQGNLNNSADADFAKITNSATTDQLYSIRMTTPNPAEASVRFVDINGSVITDSARVRTETSGIDTITIIRIGAGQDGYLKFQGNKAGVYNYYFKRYRRFPYLEAP